MGMGNKDWKFSKRLVSYSDERTRKEKRKLETKRIKTCIMKKEDIKEIEEFVLVLAIASTIAMVAIAVATLFIK